MENWEIKHPINCDGNLVYNPEHHFPLDANDAYRVEVYVEKSFGAHCADCMYTLQSIFYLHAKRRINSETAYTTIPSVYGYAQHVMTEVIEAAEQAGCDEVLTRGQFDRGFAALLQ